MNGLPESQVFYVAGDDLALLEHLHAKAQIEVAALWRAIKAERARLGDLLQPDRAMLAQLQQPATTGDRPDLTAGP